MNQVALYLELAKMRILAMVWSRRLSAFFLAATAFIPGCVLSLLC